LPGGVPDADDTAGTLLALRHLGPPEDQVRQAASAGVTWLLDVQNNDGGIPTFCRGWGALPFDRSSADITAHAIRAWLAWLEEVPAQMQKRVAVAVARALKFLCECQRPDGSWVPLWFGNQFAPEEENPTYGTARVLRALAAGARPSGRSLSRDARGSSIPASSPGWKRLWAEGRAPMPPMSKALARGTAWLLSAQKTDGSWGGCPGGPSSVEETALALEALAEVLACGESWTTFSPGELATAVVSGANWLIEGVESGQWRQPAPIGFYFAKLWYYERLYPLIFTVGALRLLADLTSRTSRSQPGYTGDLANG
jgi:squalene-hopene/tetraprenyl-beta-curcumene cyclase